MDVDCGVREAGKQTGRLPTDTDQRWRYQRSQRISRGLRRLLLHNKRCKGRMSAPNSLPQCIAKSKYLDGSLRISHYRVSYSSSYLFFLFPCLFSNVGQSRSLNNLRFRVAVATLRRAGVHLVRNPTAVLSLGFPTCPEGGRTSAIFAALLKRSLLSCFHGKKLRLLTVKANVNARAPHRPILVTSLLLPGFHSRLLALRTSAVLFRPLFACVRITLLEIRQPLDVCLQAVGLASASFRRRATTFALVSSAPLAEIAVLCIHVTHDETGFLQ